MSSHLDYYSKEFWINSMNTFDPVTYKSNVFFENIGKTHKLPDGLKVQLGVGQGYTLNKMKEHWGDDQVFGIDLYNFNNDPNVYSVDIRKLKLILPCAYIENDIGSSMYAEGKTDRWFAAQWAIKSLIPTGILITSADYSINYPVEEFARSNKCKVESLSKFDNEAWAKSMNSTDFKTSGWFIITKEK